MPKTARRPRFKSQRESVVRSLATSRDSACALVAANDAAIVARFGNIAEANSAHANRENAATRGGRVHRCTQSEHRRRCRPPYKPV